LVQVSPSIKPLEVLAWQSIVAGLKSLLYQREISGTDGPEPYCSSSTFKIDAGKPK
jgi:hypothetical protein